MGNPTQLHWAFSALVRQYKINSSLTWAERKRLTPSTLASLILSPKPMRLFTWLCGGPFSFILIAEFRLGEPVSFLIILSVIAVNSLPESSLLLPLAAHVIGQVAQTVWATITLT